MLLQAGFDRPLLMPKVEEVELLTKQREDTLIARMKMFVHLRQDLERVCFLALFSVTVNLTLYGHIKTAEQRTILQQYDDWYTGR